MFDVEVICLIASFTKKDAFDKNWELGSFGLTFSHFASHDCILVFLHRIIIVSIPPIYTSYLSHEVWSTFSARLYQFDFLHNSTHVAIHDYVAPLIVEYTCSYCIVWGCLVTIKYRVRCTLPTLLNEYLLCLVGIFAHYFFVKLIVLIFPIAMHK